MSESAARPAAESPAAVRAALAALSELSVDDFGTVLQQIVRDDNSMPLVRELAGATTAALAGIHGMAHQTFNGHSAAVVGELGELLARAHAGVVVMTAEATIRGEIAASQKANTTAWVRDHCRYLQTAGAAATGKAAGILGRPELQRVADRIITSVMPPAVAVAIATEYDKLESSLDQRYRALMDTPAVADDTVDPIHGADTDDPADSSDPAKVDDLADAEGDLVRPGPGWTVRDVVLEHFCRAGRGAGIRGVKNIRDHLLAQYGTAEAFQDDHETHRKYLELSTGRLIGGIWHYDLSLDAESRVELEASINQLSKPFPQNPDTGEIDLRSQAQRRGQALIEVCRRAVTAARDVPTSPKSFLYVTVGLDDLVNRTGYGTSIGTLTDGTKLPIDTIRKLACNAGIIPALMGSDNAVLNLGTPIRYFTTAQARALWLRDKHCTFPGCTIPATWCENHHLIHAADGGPTDLDAGALLCGRHHTIVHRDKLAGRVVDNTVIWDLRPGSYAELLEEFRASRTGAAATVSSKIAAASASTAETGPQPRRPSRGHLHRPPDPRRDRQGQTPDQRGPVHPDQEIPDRAAAPPIPNPLPARGRRHPRVRSSGREERQVRRRSRRRGTCATSSPLRGPVGRLLAGLLAGCWLLAGGWSTAGWLLAGCWSTAGWLLAGCWSTAGRLLTDRRTHSAGDGLSSRSDPGNGRTRPEHPGGTGRVA